MTTPVKSYYRTATSRVPKNSREPSGPQNQETLLKRFETYLISQRGLGLTTCNNYLAVMRRVFPVLSQRPTPRAVDKYIAEMRKRGSSTSHIINTSIALERYGDFIGVHVRLARPKCSYRLVQGTLTEAEMARFIGAAATLRERAILAVLAFSGGRNNELCRLRVSDVDAKTGKIVARGTKPGKDHCVMISPGCLALVIEYLEERKAGPNDHLFVTVRHGYAMQPQDIRKLVRTVAQRAGLSKRVYPHLIRHSLATNMLIRGSGLLAIKQQLGHVYISTTMRYLHSNPEQLQREYTHYAPAYL